MNKPHKHAELIKKWADGAEIEGYISGKWRQMDAPGWNPEVDYRVLDPFRELKEAHARGERIEFFSALEGVWEPIERPKWFGGTQYRIAPKPVSAFWVQVDGEKSPTTVLGVLERAGVRVIQLAQERPS